MDANATWSDDGSAVLLIEYRFRSSKPLEPFFNAPSSSDWWIVAYETDRTLGPRREIVRWENPSRDGGGLMHQPIFWLKKAGRLIFVESQTPYLLSIKDGRKHALRPPDAVVTAIVGPHLAANAFARSPVPSPDGRIVAVYYTATFLPEGPFGAQQFIHFMSFFGTEDGAHLRSVRIPFRNEAGDPFLTPIPKELPHYWRFLWTQDSSAVYLLEKGNAMILPVDGSRAIEAATVAPARPVPSLGGPVSRTGIYLFTAESQQKQNAPNIKQRVVPDWIPFDRVPRVPSDQVRYIGP